MTYPGGKNGAGVWQTLINQMPPHRTYIEAFLGSGAILQRKRPAEYSIGIDADAAVIKTARSWTIPNLTLHHGDALAFLRAYPWRGDELVYADPPYLMDTRSSRRAIYRHEFATEAQHLELLSLLRAIPAAVMISGYWSPLYEAMLPGWRTVSYPAVTRGGTVATEWLWMNFPEPQQLHDYRYLGSNYRQREQLKRMKARWLNKLRNMPPLKRAALLWAMQEVFEGNAGNGDSSGGIGRKDDADMPHVGISGSSDGRRRAIPARRRKVVTIKTGQVALPFEDIASP